MRQLTAPAMVALVLVAGVGLYYVKSHGLSKAPLVDSTSTVPADASADPHDIPAVSQPSDAPSIVIVEARHIEPENSQPGDEGNDVGVTVEMALTLAESSPTLKSPAFGYVIRGKVVSKDGPVRNDEPGQWLDVAISAPDHSRRCEIDEQGGFECTGLNAGSYLVSIADRMAPHRLACRPMQVELDAQTPSKELVFVLGEEVPVAATVLYDESLEPVSGCPVIAELTDGPGSASTQTDPQGCCVLSLIPGRYRMYANRDESTARVVVVSSSGKGSAVDLRVPAPRKRMIQGILVDSQGNRIKGYVDLGLAAHEPNMAPADSFCVPEPGYIPPDGLIGHAYDVSGKLARRFLWQQEAPDDELVIVLEPRARIVGRLVNSDGKPIPDAQVDLETVLPDGRWHAGDDSLYSLIMDGAGGFQLEGVALGLKVQVAAYRGQSRLQARSQVLDLRPGETCNAGEIVLRLPKVLTGVLRGRVVNEMGKPVVDRNVQIWAQAGSSLGTDQEGYFTVPGLPTDEPVAVVAEVPGYGKWSQTAIAGDLDCNFQVYPSGWGIVGNEAPALSVDRWFNHAPMTLEELRGSVVLLMFGGWGGDSRAVENAWSSIRAVDREYSSKGLVTVVICRYVPADDPAAAGVTGSYLSSLGGLPIAGCFDADPNSMVDPMPKDRPVAAMNGVTHWRYRVCMQPTLFLIDKQGMVRCCAELKDLWDRVGSLVAE